MSTYLLAAALLATGLFLLTLGAEGLVEGSLRLTRRLGMSPLVAGLTIVAFGTSCPELGVSISAAIKGVSDIALGNVLGSNIANAFLIVGIGAVISPFRPHAALVRVEMPFLLAITIGAWALALRGYLYLIFGLVAVGTFVLYCRYLYKAKGNPAYFSKDSGTASPHATRHDRLSLLKELAFILGGLFGLVYGSQIFLKGAIRIGVLLGVPELFVGLTITALGTSLPEIAATISAARRRSGDVIMGNVVGSNLANLCIVLGLTSIIRPIPVSHLVLVRDFPALLASSILLLVLGIRNGKIGHGLGVVLISLYVLYVTVISGIIQ